MIKIEKISAGASATIVRDGITQKVYLNQLITAAELDKLEVTNGTVTYSIDEQTIAEKTSTEPEKKLEIVTEVSVTEEIAPVLTTEAKPVVVKQPAEKPAIVHPVTRTVTKTK